MRPARQLTAFDTAELRAQYLVDHLFIPGEITACYTHHDRVVLGGAAPTAIAAAAAHVRRAAGGVLSGQSRTGES